MTAFWSDPNKKFPFHHTVWREFSTGLQLNSGIVFNFGLRGGRSANQFR
jgi:hypothetical protein